MPPWPRRRSSLYAPSRRPETESHSGDPADFSEDLAEATDGVVCGADDANCSYSASNDSTCSRSDSSPPQASARKAGRSAAGRSRAELKMSLTRCHSTASMEKPCESPVGAKPSLRLIVAKTAV